jgi:hypothetical protein
MGTNCAPLLADLFLYSYKSEFLQNLVQDKKIHEARAFNFTYRYSDWDITAHIWTIYDFKIEVIPFIIHFITELTTVVKFEV